MGRRDEEGSEVEREKAISSFLVVLRICYL